MAQPRKSRKVAEPEKAKRTRTPREQPKDTSKSSRTRKTREVKKPVKEEVKARQPRKPKETEEIDITRTKRKTREKIIADDAVNIKVFNPLQGIDDQLDEIEKSYSLTGSSMLPGEKRQTTGLLGLDLVLGGGIVPGWYTTFGPEQSCKSTLTMWMMLACIDSGIPIKAIWDYEGSTQPDYIDNQKKTFGIDIPIEQIFGVRNPKTQQWEIKPIVRMYNEIAGEKFFDYLAKLERALPDKRLMGDQWYYVYEGTKKNKTIVGSDYDEKYYRKTGMYRIPAPDGKLQAILLLDSYSAMLPEKQDVDDPGSAIAVQARMFSEQLKRVKGRMRSKRIAVLGVNQLRKAPMVMFGSPDVEPNGEALRFFSDVRLKATPRSLSGVPINGFKGKGMIMEEDSIRGKGTDKYRFVHVKAIKNKLSIPYQETWIRLWIEDANGEARGFDPVWDTFYYLYQTGQLKGDGKKMTLQLHKGPEFKKSLNWHGFKTLVLGSKKQQKEVCDAVGCSKSISIREFCKKQMESGRGLDLFMEAKKNQGSKQPSSSTESSDDDDD